MGVVPEGIINGGLICFTIVHNFLRAYFNQNNIYFIQNTFDAIVERCVIYFKNREIEINFSGLFKSFLQM